MGVLVLDPQVLQPVGRKDLRIETAPGRGAAPGSGRGSAVSTNFTDVQGNKSSFHGYYVDTMENGDKGEYSFRGTATMKDGAIQTAQDAWTLVRGTGKLKGAKGKGTYKGTGAADGSITWDCKGEYTLASK